MPRFVRLTSATGARQILSAQDCHQLTPAAPPAPRLPRCRGPHSDTPCPPEPLRGANNPSSRSRAAHIPRLHGPGCSRRAPVSLPDCPACPLRCAASAPWFFFPTSYPTSPPISVVFVLWLSTISMLGAAARPALRRSCSRSTLSTSCQTWVRHHLAK